MFKKIKIYLSSASVPIIPQMIDFVGCAEDQGIIKIISWYRNEISKEKLKGTQAIYIRQNALISHEYISCIMGVINKFNPKEVEVHANVVLCRTELCPVINALLGSFSREKITVHLYDDGMRAICDRNELHQLPESDFLLAVENNVKYLKQILNVGDNPFLQLKGNEWPALMGYIWHKIFNVKYHLMNTHEMMIYSQTPFSKFLDRNVETMHHHDFNGLTKKQTAFCFSLMNINMGVVNEISNKINHRHSLLYMGTGFFIQSQDDTITDKQVAKIISLKNKGIIKDDDVVLFKPHPINSPQKP